MAYLIALQSGAVSTELGELVGFFDTVDRRNQEVVDHQLDDDPSTGGRPSAFEPNAARNFAFGLVLFGVLLAIGSRVTNPDIALGALILFLVIAGVIGIVRAVKSKA